MSVLKKGYVQIYTGNGKGKTTAAVGQGVRAAGNNLTVYMIQFLKSNDTGELKSLKLLEPGFKIFRFEKKRGFFWTLNDEEKKELKEEVHKAFLFALEVMNERKCDMLILDEIMGVLHNKLLEEKQVLQLIAEKPEDMELIMTGRNVPQSIADRANLVTEMKDIKHYFSEGVPARQGIEY